MKPKEKKRIYKTKDKKKLVKKKKIKTEEKNQHLSKALVINPKTNEAKPEAKTKEKTLAKKKK
ncbi:2098_t:CDS:2, partial [Racocetra fulgida]